VEPPDFATIVVGIADDGVRGRLTLARPDKLNPLSFETLEEIVAAAAWFDTQPGLKVVVVSGEGRSFSSGADVAAFAGATDVEADVRHAVDAGRRMADALEAMRPVTVAAIHGHCVGGGVVLAAACDLRIAASNAVFRIPEIDLGIPLAWGGIPRLVRDIGPVLTKELVMTCRPFEAEEALGAGFLNQVVAAGELDQAVETLVATLVAKPRHALLTTKRHVNAVTATMTGVERSWADADGLLVGLSDPEGRAAAARYLESLRSV
jgi:enoyl-CoA hydratase/carnithine racemase